MGSYDIKLRADRTTRKEIVMISKGNQVWIPCEVKDGPFSDERIVRVQSTLGEALVFVRTAYLREPIIEGETCVRALVTEVRGDKFMAQIPGRAISIKEFEGDLARIS